MTKKTENTKEAEEIKETEGTKELESRGAKRRHIRGMFLEKSVEVTDLDEKKAVYEKTGWMDRLVPKLEPMTPEEFAKSAFFLDDSWKYHEIKFLIIDEEKGVLNRCHVFHYPDGNGIVLSETYDEEKDESKPLYFRFYLCKHDYPSCEDGHCELHPTCKLCGYTR